MLGIYDHGTPEPAGISEPLFMKLIFKIGAFRANVNKPDHAINSMCFYTADLSSNVINLLLKAASFMIAERELGF